MDVDNSHDTVVTNNNNFFININTGDSDDGDDDNDTPALKSPFEGTEGSGRRLLRALEELEIYLPQLVQALRYEKAFLDFEEVRLNSNFNCILIRF